jgi:hypothetical protein
MEDGDMVMNDEDRKFVEAVRQLGDTTHYMGVLISELPGLPAKLMAAEFRAEKAEAENAKLCDALWQALDDMADGTSVCKATKALMRTVLAECEGKSDDA